MSKENIFMHFRPEERPFVERSLDYVHRASDRNQLVVTPFLDPREQFILTSVVKREPDLLFCLDGGYPEAERKRALIVPDYYGENPEWTDLVFYRLETKDSKELKHRDVLGALTGLGIKRNMLGDILPHGKGCDIIVAGEMAEYIFLGIGQVGRHRVSIRKINRAELTLPERNGKIRTASVASMRVDAVISEGYRVSRTKAASMVKSGKCKVNWKLVDQPDYPVAPGDLISLRGFGRLAVESIEGHSKKGRIWIKLSTYH
ncbi:RNA-binding protein [Thermoactinomyces intermedius]|jgi:RNA-binding protein YlmH|uniref:RNA-binding protein n=1 Tax=Thermoactinomyces intermedius TaxID=2024 RepID=A0A8I1A3Q2_THEIN|nr:MULTISPECIES: YlmH/Sll1252 family protein [Thermoactinomyces]MBA4547542.1 RNA-binding protein [Thermoactinomyces intermedius]MBA4836182.1 RNA-binding protein [Thermoactinomyces intermedius]MBH8594229.1 RNA-binding protein [Thermoactinomyces intermedius]MBH8601065.1 RNA-binding protein [Thermoactinomyces sp. CICC 23799]